MEQIRDPFIHEELVPGERVVWSGQPDAEHNQDSVIKRSMTILFIMFGIMGLLIFTSSLIITTSTPRGDNSVLVFGISFVAFFGLIPVLLGYRIRYGVKKAFVRIHYGVTDQRLLIIHEVSYEINLYRVPIIFNEESQTLVPS